MGPTMPVKMWADSHQFIGPHPARILRLRNEKSVSVASISTKPVIPMPWPMSEPDVAGRSNASGR